MSAVVVSADEILPRWRDLVAASISTASVSREMRNASAQWSLGEVLAHASRGEQLHPGELFGTGTLPGGSGIENGHAARARRYASSSPSTASARSRTAS